MTQKVLEKKSLEYLPNISSSPLFWAYDAMYFMALLWLSKAMWLIQENELWEVICVISRLDPLLTDVRCFTASFPSGSAIGRAWYCGCSISLSPWGIPMNRALLEQEINLVICHRFLGWFLTAIKTEPVLADKLCFMPLRFEGGYSALYTRAMPQGGYLHNIVS